MSATTSDSPAPAAPKRGTGGRRTSSDLQALVAGLAQSGAALHNYLFDHVNLAEVINYMAANVVVQNIDRTVKNFYVYRDTTGTGEWQMFPWDVDLAFGPNALNTDVIEATDDSPNQHTSHPFFGGTQFSYTGLTNRLLDAVYQNPVTREMYLRRLRSLMDQLLNAPGTPVAERYFEDRIDELVALLSTDVLADRAKWGASAHFGGTTYTLQQAADRIKNEYLAPRRTHLFQTHAATSQTGIPTAQVGIPVIEFAAVEFAPMSGNQDEEFIQLFNPRPFAVDVTGWKLTGGIEHVFTPGTVIPAGQSLYVVPDAVAFRARPTGPSGGQGLYVQGNYQGHLSNFGETIDLVAADDSVVATTTTPSVPSDAQRYLRITEVMYHPPAPQPHEIALGYSDQDDFEYVELLNISDATTPTTLDLTGVRFSEGLSFSFTAASSASLAPGERILIGRSAAALAARYGAGLPVAGEFVAGEGLANGGEPLKLEDAEGGTIHEFDYEDDWYPLTDGGGHSLAVVSAGQPLDAWDGINGWRASFALSGSPGEPDLLPGDANGDEQVDRLDLETLQSHVGLSVGASRQQGDFNRDGAINRLDAAILAVNYGRSSLPPPQPPAPSAASISQPARARLDVRASGSRRAPSSPRRPLAAATVDSWMSDLPDDSTVTIRATGRRGRSRDS